MIDLSYSEIRDYRRCPFLFKLKRDGAKGHDDDRRGFVGVLLQKLVEEFYVEQWWRDLLLVEATMHDRAAVLFRLMTDGGGIDWTPEDRLEAETRIADAIPLILATVKQERLLTRTVYPELELTLALPHVWPDGQDVVLHGRADFVYDAPPSLMVLDGKAGSTIGRFAPVDQLRVYALALETHPAFRRRPTRAGFWWFRRGVVAWKKLTPTGLVLCRERLVETVQVMAAGQFDPTPGTHCAPCAFRLQCPAGKAYGLTRTSKAVLDAEENSGMIGF